MGETTGIEWADATWNPWVGCARVSPGCDHCYMFGEQARRGIDGSLVRRTKSVFNLPLARHRDRSYRIPDGARVFTCSYSDFFIPEADAWRPEAWALIQARPKVHFLILTKRPGRIRRCLPPGGLPRNVWLGVSVESQDYTWRIDKLLEIDATVRFISAEPLLGPLDLTNVLSVYDQHGEPSGPRCRDDGRPVLDWLIVGGESGPNARPMDPRWAAELALQAVEAGVAVHFKQWGEWAPSPHPSAPSHLFGLDGRGREVRAWHVGKRAAGRALLGRVWDEYPEVAL